MNPTPGTEPSNAQGKSPWTLERQGRNTEPHVRRLPTIRGGVCEFCGVLDGRYPASDQWKLCPHFRGIEDMRCSYCDESVNPTEVVLRSLLNTAEHPSNPGQLVVWCNSFKCSEKHLARFQANRS